MQRYILAKNGDSLVLTVVDGELKVLMGIRDQIRPGVNRVYKIYRLVTG